MRPGAGYHAQRFPLAGGDRVVFVTDGMLDRNAARVDVATLLAGTRGLHPRETVRALTRAVRRACGGQLRDDAAVWCLDWYGGPRRDRDVSRTRSSA